jgi:GT2 family glycosyltransferase
MRESSADMLLWTDDDVLVDHGWMEALLRGADQQQAAFVFGRSIPHWMVAAPDWFSSLHNGRFALLDYGDKSFLVSDPDRGFFGLNFGTRREALLRLGGCDESMGFTKAGGAAGEDTDLCRRALAAGLRIAYVPDAVVSHMIPARRTTKRFYRDRVKAAATRDYQRLRDQFIHVPWFAGLPRFMIRNAAADAFGYVVRTARGDRDQAFDYELKLRRFASYCRAAATRTLTHTEERAA